MPKIPVKVLYNTDTQDVEFHAEIDGVDTEVFDIETPEEEPEDDTE
tara:strand:- start:3906 stop:4043 length:138 start_codon:yes stop_codon:yes gene_type:complete